MLQQLFDWALKIAGSAADPKKVLVELLSHLLPLLGIPGDKVEYVLARLGDVAASDMPAEQLWLEVDGILADIAQDGNLGSILGKGGAS